MPKNASSIPDPSSLQLLQVQESDAQNFMSEVHEQNKERNSKQSQSFCLKSDRLMKIYEAAQSHSMNNKNKDLMIESFKIADSILNAFTRRPAKNRSKPNTDFQTFAENVKGYNAENAISRYFNITLALEVPEIEYLSLSDILIVG